MAVLPVQDTKGGLEEIVFETAASGGDVVAAGTRAGGWSLGVLLLVAKASTGDREVTVQGKVHTIPAGEMGAIPVTSIYHGSPVAITYDGSAANTTVAAIRI